MKLEDKDDFYNTIFTELKKIGVKVPKVKKFKSIISKQEKALPPSKSKIFGVSLCDQEWTSNSDCLLPKFIASSIAYLREYINSVGLFRKAGSLVRQRELRLRLEKGENLDGSEPNDVASLLKQWLRELPEPLIPHYMHDLYIRCQHLEVDESRITANLLTCLLLPPDHLYTLKHLLSFLSDCAANSDKNMMGSRNLALIMAPNIFILGSDSADKCSPDLVETHTSVTQLLIENASKVGEVPASVSFQHSVQDGKSCSELDSSADILDFSPLKSRKKRRSGTGTVQDLFNGIKKLVGQNATPVNPTPRSASKRKAEYNDGSLPKKQTVEVNGELNNSNGTPKNKGNKNLLSTSGKTGNGHTRRKSFGLLRRKERKRQKSAQESPQSKLRLGVEGPLNWNVEVNVDTANSTLQVPSPISPFNLFDGKKLSKSGSIKKTTSDCYLVMPSVKVPGISISSSQGHLQDTPKAFPYNLRSKFEGSKKSQMQSLESIQLEMKNIIDDTENKHKSLQQKGDEVLPVEKSPTVSSNSISEIFDEDETFVKTNKPLLIDSSFSVPKIQDLTVGLSKGVSHYDPPSRRTSSRKKVDGSRNNTAENISENTNVSNENFETIDSCSLLSETLLQLDTNLSRKGNSRASHKNGITRQDAFIIKSKQKLKNSLDQAESSEVSNLKLNKKSHGNQSLKKDLKNHQLRKTQSVSLDSKSENHGKNVSGRKVTSKTSRKASLIRGRPNTVKSGLPSDLCQRFSNDSILSPNSSNIENASLLTENHTKEKVGISLHSQKNETPFQVPMNKPNQDGRETSLSEERDISLNFKFEKFTLSSPPTNSIEDNQSSVINSNLNTFSIFEDSSCSNQNSNIHLDTVFDVPQVSGRKLSLPICPVRVSDSSDSKIPRLRNSLEVAGTNSFSEAKTDLKRKVLKPRVSNSKTSIGNPTKIPVRSADSLKDLSTLNLSMNDSCFKTPNKIASPDSVTWVSGSKYLGLNSSFEEDVFNKRESIAMILKSKPGHVQATVSLWDTKVRDSVYCTRSVPTYSTPTAAFNNSETSRSRSSQKQRASSQRNRKPLSISRSCDSTGSCKSSGKPQKLMLPPPPKFVVSEPNTPSPNINRPLKEVTNISFGMNESKNSMNSSLLKDESGIPKHSLPSQNHKKLKRNSFSVNSPQKFQKKVSRSESSPSCRPRGRVSRLKQESMFDNTSILMENSENDPLVTRRLTRTSASKSGSCLSIEKLRSDQMIDEWQCQM